MAEKRDLLCLFDVDGTLTPSRLVGLDRGCICFEAYSVQLQVDSS